MGRCGDDEDRCGDRNGDFASLLAGLQLQSCAANIAAASLYGQATLVQCIPLHMHLVIVVQHECYGETDP